MEMSLYAGLIWLTAIVIASLDLTIILGSKNYSSRVFALLSFITAVWVVSHGFFLLTPSVQISNILIRFQYFLGISIATGFYHFSIIYPYDKRLSKKSVIVSGMALLMFACLYLFTDTLITDTVYIGGIGKWSWNFGSLHWLFEIAFCGLWIIALKNLFVTYRKTSGELRLNLQNMFWALCLGIIPPTLVNILLPTIGYYSLDWFGPISSAIWILIIAYSIIRYRQMSVRTVVTEVLAIGMTVIFFINIFAGSPLGVNGRVVIFLTFLILATYLIRGTLRESRQREQLSTLNATLAEKVAEQTAEIRKAYELEKHARRELEKLNETKDQFILMTQHHLRTPVTAIKWRLESIMRGTHGEVAPAVKQALGEAEGGAARLTRIVDEFLNISTLKPGRNILDIKEQSLLPAITEILADLALEIERSRLIVSCPRDPKSWPKIPVDLPKMRDALQIVIENAVRYNREGGSIDITTATGDGYFEITVANTGIGISGDELTNIGSSLFYRGTEAKKRNSVGMGVGLSVAKAVVKAHHGALEITSGGPGKGAEVKIRMSDIR